MIREANKEDLNTITDLWQEMMDFHIEKSDLYQIKPDAREIYLKYLKDVLKSPDYITLVFEGINEVLGYLIATESNEPPVYEGTVGLILELSVTRKHRNKGIGEELVTAIEKYFENKGINRIECMVSDFNEVSKGFWFKNGYKPYNIMCVKLLD
jgi:ribosomal protein S18 acetylase RimI-like enzyme